MATFGWIKCQVSKIGNNLPDELAKLKKMGVATEPGDLEPNPAIPPGQNAAILYEELFAEMKKLKEDPSQKSFFNALQNYGSYRATPQDNVLVETGLSKLLPFFTKTDRLTELKRLHFSRDYSQGMYVQFPEYSQMKDLAKWQGARSTFYLKQGDYASSLKALECIFAISQHCFQEPTIIATLVATAIDAIAISFLDKHLEAIKANQVALAEARKLLEALPEAFDLKPGMAGEIVLGRISIQRLRHWREIMGTNEYWNDEEGQQRSDPIDGFTLKDPAVRRMLETKFLEMWRKTYEMMPTDGTDWRTVSKAMTATETAVENDKSLENYLNQMMFPSLSQYATTAGYYQARHRLSLLAIRLLQDRPKGLPKDLSRYGDLATDPLDGKPMRFSFKGGGFKVWSVGRNQKDDGGVKFYPGTGMSNQNTDEVQMFFYPETPPAITYRPPAPSALPLPKPPPPPPFKLE